MSAWESFARISGVAFQVFAAVGIGILAGYGVDRLVPPVTPWGVLIGAAVGFVAAIYLMVAGMRAYIASEGGPATNNEEDRKP